MTLLLNAALVLAGISVLLLIISPPAGIMATFLAKPVIDATFDQTVVGGLRLTYLTGAALPVVVTAHLVLARLRNNLVMPPLFGAWIIYTVYIIFFSSHLLLSSGAEVGSNIFFRHISAPVGYFMLQHFFVSETRKRALIIALVISGLFPVGMSVIQIITGMEWRTQNSGAEGVTRIVGLYHDAVSLKFYSLQTIFACTLLAHTGEGAVVNRRIINVILFCLFCLAVFCLMNTYTKSGIAVLGLWVVIWFAFRRKFISLACILLVSTTLFVAAAPRYAANMVSIYHKELSFYRGDIELERTFAGRWFGWQDMYDQWLSLGIVKQVFGSGIPATGAHNDYLMILFHGGLLGLLIYSFIILSMICKATANALRNPAPLNVGAVMLLTMWIVDSTGTVPSAYPGYQWFVMGMIGLSFTSERSRRVETSPARDHLARGLRETYHRLVRP